MIVAGFDVQIAELRLAWRPIFTICGASFFDKRN